MHRKIILVTTVVALVILFTKESVLVAQHATSSPINPSIKLRPALEFDAPFEVMAVAVSSDSMYLASKATITRVRLSFGTTEQLAVLGEDETVLAIAVSGDGSHLLAAFLDCAVLWRVSGERPVEIVRVPYTSPERAIAVNHSGSYFALANGPFALVFSVASQKPICELELPSNTKELYTSSIRELAWAQDGTKLGALSTNSVGVFSTPDGALLWKQVRSGLGPRHLCWTSLGQMGVTLAPSVAKVYDGISGECVWERSEHADTIILPDGLQFVVRGAVCTLRHRRHSVSLAMDTINDQSLSVVSSNGGRMVFRAGMKRLVVFEIPRLDSP